MTPTTHTKQDDMLSIVGDYWTLRILLALKNNEDMRFCGMQRELDDLNPVTLTNRLKKLEEAGLIDRFEDTESKAGICYRLNSHGKRFMPLLAELEKLS